MKRKENFEFCSGKTKCNLTFGLEDSVFLGTGDCASLAKFKPKSGEARFC